MSEKDKPIRVFNPTKKYNYPLTGDYSLSGSINKSSATTSADSEEEESEQASSLYDTYLKELKTATKIGNLGDLANLVASIPGAIQQRQKFPTIKPPIIEAPQLRNNAAMYRNISLNTLGTADATQRKYLSEAGMQSLYSTSQAWEQEQQANKVFYDRNRDIAAANAQMAYQARASNAQSQMQAEAAEREGQFKLDELTRQTRAQSLANIFKYGSSISKRVVDAKTNALYAAYAKAGENDIFSGLRLEHGGASSGSGEIYIEDGVLKFR